MEIKDRIAIVTGGASGIGRATVQRLAAEGATVVTVDVDTERGEETAQLVEGAGGRAMFIKADVTSSEDMRAVFGTTVSRFGRVDILHNNAGISSGGGVDIYPNGTIDSWRRVIKVDFEAVALGCYLAFPLMKENGGGTIVNTASMAGLYPIPSDPIYAAAKAGVIHLTQSLTGWREHGIRVNCVCPGSVDTPMVQRIDKQRRLEGLESIKPKKSLQPEMIADVVAMFVRDDNINGSAVEVRPSGLVRIEARRAPGS
jgi:NAD(P)-dependent dehydrogenase (short-subunit alcohol dehydrogenase family)